MTSRSLSGRTGPVRVAYVVPPSDHFAGIERVTHELASALAMQTAVPITVTVIYFTDYPEVASPPYAKIVAAGDRVRHVPAALDAILREQAFDVVFVPQFEIAVLCLAYNRLRGRRDPIVLHLHGNPDIERRTSIKARALFATYRFAARRFAGIVTVSQGLARATRAELGDRVDIRYLPNPVRQLPVRAEAATAATGRGFVTVGRLAFQKGHDIAIRAMRQVVNRYPDAVLTIVGDGPERPVLEELIGRLGLEGNVVLRGTVSDPAADLAAARAFVIASRWEGFGVAIVEALSAGLPVIAARCDFGPEDIVTAPELGMLVPPEDPDALAAAMIAHLSTLPVGTAAARHAHAAQFARDAVVAQHAQYLAGFDGPG